MYLRSIANLRGFKSHARVQLLLVSDLKRPVRISQTRPGVGRIYDRHGGASST